MNQCISIKEMAGDGNMENKCKKECLHILILKEII